MSIRLLAQDLYNLHKEVERLERSLANTPIGKQAPIEAELRKAKADRDSLRRALDGKLDR